MSVHAWRQRSPSWVRFTHGLPRTGLPLTDRGEDEEAPFFANAQARPRPEVSQMNHGAIKQVAADWYAFDGEVRNLVTDPVVREWRYQSLIRASFTANQAEVVSADAGIDIHWLIGLTRRGCPQATACRIAGLDLLEGDRSRTPAPV
jgi:hypothetical protein